MDKKETIMSAEHHTLQKVETTKLLKDAYRQNNMDA